MIEIRQETPDDVPAVRDVNERAFGGTAVAERCGTHPHATEKLLNALVGVGCLRVRGERYNLPRSARTWLLKNGKNSVRDQNLLHYLEWR